MARGGRRKEDSRAEAEAEAGRAVLLRLCCCFASRPVLSRSSARLLLVLVGGWRGRRGHASPLEGKKFLSSVSILAVSMLLRSGPWIFFYFHMWPHGFFFLSPADVVRSKQTVAM